MTKTTLKNLDDRITKKEILLMVKNSELIINIENHADNEDYSEYARDEFMASMRSAIKPCTDIDTQKVDLSRLLDKHPLQTLWIIIHMNKDFRDAFLKHLMKAKGFSKYKDYHTPGAETRASASDKNYPTWVEMVQGKPRNKNLVALYKYQIKLLKNINPSTIKLGIKTKVNERISYIEQLMQTYEDCFLKNHKINPQLEFYLDLEAYFTWDIGNDKIYCKDSEVMRNAYRNLREEIGCDDHDKIKKNGCSSPRFGDALLPLKNNIKNEK